VIRIWAALVERGGIARGSVEDRAHPQRGCLPCPAAGLPAFGELAGDPSQPRFRQKFEDSLDELLAVGDFQAALRLVFSQPNRSDANDVFALKLVNQVNNPESIGAILED